MASSFQSTKVPQTYLESRTQIPIKKNLGSMNSLNDSSSNYFGSTLYTRNPMLQSNHSNFQQRQSINQEKQKTAETLPNQIPQQFKWKEIMKLNPNNFQEVQPFIPMILNSQISENEVSSLPEKYIIHLLSLTKSIAFNAMSSMDYLRQDNERLGALLLSKGENDDETQSQYLKIIESLQQQNNTKDKLIAKYKRMINPNNEFSMKEKIFFCPYCSGKKFLSQDYLDEHLRRRHLISKTVKTTNIEENIDVKETSEMIDQKISKMKNEFESMLLSTGMNQMKGRINNIQQSIQMRNMSFIPNEPGRTFGSLNQNEKIVIENRMNLSQDQLLRTVESINRNIEKNAAEYDERYNELFDEIKKFKINFSNEVSSIKQSQSFSRARKSFNESNDAIKFKYLTPERRQKKLQSVKMKGKTNMESIREEASENGRQKTPKSQDKSFMKDYANANIPTKTTNNETTITDGKVTQYSITKHYQEEGTDTQNNENGQKIKSENHLQIPQLESQHFSQNSFNSGISSQQSPDEKAIQEFYNKFRARDSKYNGYIENYYQIIPQQPNIHYEDVIRKTTNNKIYDFTDYQIRDLNSLQTLNKDCLLDIINTLYSDIGEKSNRTYYGYYSKNLDLLFNMKELIDSENSNDFNFSKSESLNQNNIYDSVGVNIQSSNAFSFNQSVMSQKLF